MFVSHDTHAVLNLCERAIWLDQGILKHSGPARDVVDLYTQGLYQQSQPLDVPRGNEKIDMEPVANASTELASCVLATSEKDFGTGDIQIKSVSLVSLGSRSDYAMDSGRRLTLQVDCACEVDVIYPLFGFIVKDRLGQYLFNYNTSLAQGQVPARITKGTRFRIKFNFGLPDLAVGEYTVSVAVGEGSPGQAVIHHWIHDVVAFRSQATHVLGLIGFNDPQVQWIDQPE